MAKKEKGTATRRLTRAERRRARLSAKEKAAALAKVDKGRTQVDVGAEYGVHPKTIRNWLKRRGAAREEGDATGESGLAPRSTRPHHSPSAVSKARRKLIVELKEKHREMGPAQLRNQLRRFYGISLCHKVIGKVLREAGYELEKRIKDDEPSVQRFEMSRPNELWTMDTKYFFVNDQRAWLIDIIDDYSRFVVGHRLLGSAACAKDAIETLKDAIARHGKPERVLTDRGSEFHSWRGFSQFTKFLEDEGIEHSLARPHHPQTCGKVEALHRTLEKELFGVKRFDSSVHARRELAAYFEHYNFERTHMGIGGVTPADRYFGRIDQVLSDLERTAPAIDRDAHACRLPGERAVVLQLVLIDGKLELFFAGKRIELG